MPEPTEHAVESEVAGMDEAGWSNSPEAKDAPHDEYPDVAPPEEVQPGWSNRGGGAQPEAEKAEAEAKPAEGAEDKVVKAPAKKAAAKKSTSKKG